MNYLAIRFIIILTSLACICFGYAPDKLIVCTSRAGCLKGTYMPGYQSKRFEAFMGIPYALPPVGELRFNNPKVMPKWQGIYNATSAKADCIQKNYLLPTPIVMGQEDCLYLNVYRPEKRSRQPLPVMAYIHGGGFFSGSAGPLITGPEYFMDTSEVILVTMAYRLGALGFLSTEDSNISGNFGLKDQSLALRWIQQNIGAFGGNPRQVTIFGQSAGGVATHMHMLSAKSDSLFKNVISMSGTANVPFAIESQPLAQARKTAKLSNIPDAENLSTAKLARALRNVDVNVLLAAGDGLKFWNVDHMTNYRPVVESFNSKDAFLRDHPKNMIAKGNYHKKPWLIGTVPGEGAVRVVNIMENQTLRNEFNSQFDTLLEQLLEFPVSFNENQLTEKMKLIVKEYFQDEHELNESTALGFMDLITDRGFKHPLYNSIRSYIRTADPKMYPLYMYSFNYSGTYSYASSLYTNVNLTQQYGVVHCDDLIYLFRSPLLFPDFDRKSLDAKVINEFVNNFVHFAKYSKPKDIESYGSCTETALQMRPNGICDYQEFVNKEPESFIVKKSQEFQVDRVKLWEKILEQNHSLLNPYT